MEGVAVSSTATSLALFTSRIRRLQPFKKSRQIMEDLSINLLVVLGLTSLAESVGRGYNGGGDATEDRIDLFVAV